MHAVQDKGTVGAQAVQALRAWVCLADPCAHRLLADNKMYSGDKKTKGAALVF